MSLSEIEQLIAGCDRFLAYHYPRTIRERMQEIADSPLALKRQDGYGSGGLVTELEVEVAELLGKESAVFMPSGTMAQQIALRIWSDEAGNPSIAYHPTSHLEIHEQMAYQELHHLNAILVGEADRLFDLDDLQRIDRTVATLLIELPQREIGGQLPTWDELVALCQLARSKGMKVHLDGARLWECKPFYRRTYAQICGLFDSVYVSFYKILGGLPGAILAGPKDLIAQARIWQRRHGGNLQQQAPSAIAAKIGMDRHLPRMADYVAKTAEVAKTLNEFPEIRVVPENPPTNMMHLYFEGNLDRLVQAAKQVAREDRVLLFTALPPSGKVELTIGNAALDLSADEVRGLFQKMFQLAL